MMNHYFLFRFSLEDSFLNMKGWCISVYDRDLLVVKGKIIFLGPLSSSKDSMKFAAV